MTGAVVHGGTARYAAGCRCDDCLAGEAQRARDRRARRVERASESPDSVPHGTESGYTNHGCRCARCREATWAARRRRGTL